MKVSGRFGRFSRVAIFLLALSLSATGCDFAKNQMEYDRTGEFKRQEYRDLMSPIKTAPKDNSVTPDFQAVVSTPDDLKLPSPLVTVSVNQSVGLRDLMYQLAEQAEVDLELDPQIRGSLIFTAKDRPFDQVVDRICAMAGLRYTFANNVLRVELDRPYVKNYDVGFLNVERKGDSSIKTTSSSSDSNATNKIESNLWKDLNDGLEQLLSASDTYISLATLYDPVATVQTPLPAPVVNPDPNAPPTPPPLPGSPEVAPIPAAQAPVVNITTPASSPLLPNPPSTFSISKQTGVASIFTSARQHKLIKKYVDEFRRRVSTQVLIEAKVLQVDLNDEFASGIDWGKLDLTGLINVSGKFAFAGATSTTSSFGVTFTPGSDFSTAIQAIGTFGTVRTLSSPRVAVLNNQPAVVNVTKDNVYFNFSATTTPSTTSGVAPTVSLTSEQKNAPEGVVLIVIPTANAETGDITLAVRPTISKVINNRPDPTLALQLAIAGVAAPAGLPTPTVPELTIQEIDSMLNMQSGQMMALGGLMKDENKVLEDGIPVIGDLPVVGSLFKSHKDVIAKSELVVLVRAVIVSGNNTVDDMDRRMYNFNLDRHPGPM